jgi:hypothetical protein
MLVDGAADVKTRAELAIELGFLHLMRRHLTGQRAGLDSEAK